MKFPISLTLVITFVLILSLWLTNLLLIRPLFGLCLSSSEIGPFGDSFGALNTLFSGLAFGGLVISIFYQRKELVDTRKEIAAQTKALKSQYSEAQFQRNMNALYQQISLVQNTEQVQIEKLRSILKGYRDATANSKQQYFKQVKDNIWHAHVAIERTTTLLKLAQYIIDSKSWVTSEGNNQKRIELVRMLVVGNVPSRIGAILKHHSSEVLRGINYQKETQHGGATSITDLVGLFTDLTIDATAHSSSNM